MDESTPPRRPPLSGRPLATLLVGTLCAGVWLLVGTFGVGACSRASGGEPGTAHPRATSGTPCPEFSTGRILGYLGEDDLQEVSGMVVSRKNPGIVWVHNDSGARARLHAVTYSGKYRGAFPLRGAELVDWEDIAIGPGTKPDQWFIYVSDLGANKTVRDHGMIYRVLEPEILPGKDGEKRRLNNVDAYRIIYPDHRQIPDSEALMVDPRDSRVYVLTKSRDDDPRVYRAPLPLEPDRENVLELIASLRPASGKMGEVTAGEISFDGSRILLRTYSEGYMWQRGESDSVADALRRVPCEIRLKDAIQGEAIAWAPWGLGFMTMSEGKNEPIYYYSVLE